MVEDVIFVFDIFGVGGISNTLFNQDWIYLNCLIQQKKHLKG